MNLLKHMAVLGALVLAGCASGGRCVGDFPYQKAENDAPLQGTSEVKSPESPSALRIPPPPKSGAAFAEHVSDPAKPGKTKVSCLDTPPNMPEPTPVPAAAAPAPAPAAPKP